MKDYLYQFRTQVFDGAISLYKRIFIPYLLLNIFTTVLTAALVIPLMLQLFGWSLADLSTLESRMQEMNQTLAGGQDPQAYFMSFLNSLNLAYLIPLFIVVLLFYPWTMNLYFQLNDSEVRFKDKGLMRAINNSFNLRVFSLLGYFLLYGILSFSVMFLYLFLISLLMKASAILGSISGFIGFFFVVIFLLRFIIGPAAIVHGRLTISEAFAYSYSKINMKRAGMLILIGLVMIVLAILTSFFITILVGLFVTTSGSDPMAYFIVNQLFSTVLGALIGAFIYAGMSALYFRYSDDELEENEVDHIIAE